MTEEEYKDDCLDDSIKERFQCFRDELKKAKRDSRKQVGSSDENDTDDSSAEDSVESDENPPLQLTQQDEADCDLGDEDDFTT